MSLKIANDTANGNVILKGQNVAGDRTITMPNLDCELAPRMQLMTAQNSTSGTSIDFTGIPSWVKRITVMFNGVSTSGTSLLLVQLVTSSGIETSGYAGSSSVVDASITYSTYSSGFIVGDALLGSQNYRGSMEILSFSSVSYIEKHTVSMNSADSTCIGGGSKTLSSTLDGIRVTTVNGTDTFDAGQINVLYEG